MKLQRTESTEWNMAGLNVTLIDFLSMLCFKTPVCIVVEKQEDKNNIEKEVHNQRRNVWETVKSSVMLCSKVCLIL